MSTPTGGFEASTVEFLEGLPSFDGLLHVVNGDFDPHTFVAAVDNSQDFDIVPSNDGLVSTVQGGADGIDRSRRSDSLGFHSDGVYLPIIPDVFALACADAGGGHITTLFSDTKAALRSIKDYVPVLERLTQVYIGKTGILYPRPLVEPHPIDGEPVVNLTTLSFIMPKLVGSGSIEGIPPQSAITEALAALNKAVQESVVYEHTWRAGDVVLNDNHMFVHARLAKQPDPTRLLYRIWLRSGTADATNIQA